MATLVSTSEFGQRPSFLLGDASAPASVWRRRASLLGESGSRSRGCLGMLQGRVRWRHLEGLAQTQSSVRFGDDGSVLLRIWRCRGRIRLTRDDPHIDDHVVGHVLVACDQRVATHIFETDTVSLVDAVPVLHGRNDRVGCVMGIDHDSHRDPCSGL